MWLTNRVPPILGSLPGVGWDAPPGAEWLDTRGPATYECRP